MDSSGSATRPAASQSPVVVDSVVLLGLRVVYFFLSRKFLLSTINPTLRDLSKSETLLPSSSGPARPSSNLNSPSLRPQDFELDGDFDTEDDGLLSANSPAPSYPPTPTRGSQPLPGSSRAPYRSSTDNLVEAGAGGGVEMAMLGQKLKDASKRQVIQLTHGKSAVGTKKTKRATRGLNRIARMLFSACFAEGCNLLTLVIFHALGILHSR